jgi:hypothetical protein
MPDFSALLRRASYVLAEAEPDLCGFADRHSIVAASVLTVCDDDLAAGIASMVGPRIEGRTVVEIGGGIGLLACHLAGYAKRVYCIEANPLWSSVFVRMLFARKPKNLSYLFGAASEFAGQFNADVALFCTHSGIESMTAAGHLFAPLVVDVYGEMIAAAPENYDPMARLLRPLV